MTNTSGPFLEYIRNDKAAWIVDQMTSSFTEGIAQSAKDTSEPLQADFRLITETASRRERARREKYETSRPYEEAEKITLIEYALHEVFVTLPAIQDATARSLADLGSTAQIIEFSAPDGEERVESSYALALEPRPELTSELAGKLGKFMEAIGK